MLALKEFTKPLRRKKSTQEFHIQAKLVDRIKFTQLQVQNWLLDEISVSPYRCRSGAALTLIKPDFLLTIDVFNAVNIAKSCDQINTYLNDSISVWTAPSNTHRIKTNTEKGEMGQKKAPSLCT